MPSTFSEKILAKYAGKSEVVPGEIVEVTPDVAMSHDNTAAIARTFEKIGVEKLYDPDIHVIMLDHCVPPANAAFAQNHKEVREFVRKHGVRNFYDIQNGICHQVMVEEGHCLPGTIMTGSDSHTTTYGALGAFGTGVTRSETAVIMATGKIWFRVPETMRILLRGGFDGGVYVKDLALTIIGKIRADGALYRAVEFDGSAAHRFSISERMTLANLAVEMGAKVGYIPPDESVYRYLEGRAKREYEPIFSDEGCDYIEELKFDLGEIEPSIALPHTVDNVKTVRETEGEPIEQVFVGTCNNSRLDDLAILAHVLEGRKVNERTRLIVIPASSRIMIDAMRLGYMDTIIAAGGTLGTPGCGPCMGNHMGVPANGEKTLSTANRNFKGRMGNKDSEIFLASPHTCAVSAVTGKISDPREIPVDLEKIRSELSHATLSPVFVTV